MNDTIQDQNGADLTGSVSVDFTASTSAPTDGFGRVINLDLESTYLTTFATGEGGLEVFDDTLPNGSPPVYDNPNFSANGGSASIHLVEPIPPDNQSIPLRVGWTSSLERSPGGRPFGNGGAAQNAFFDWSISYTVSA